MDNHKEHGFAPQRIFKAWHERFPESIPHLHTTIIEPCMEEIALQEIDKVINDPRLKVRLKSCTLDYIRTALNPSILPDIYREDAPYSWDYLTRFTTSPNEHRKKRVRRGGNAKISTPVEPDEWEETLDGGTDESTQISGETGGFWNDMGFTRNPIFPLVFVFSIMAFTRNTSTNLFPMIFGLFLEIGGTGSRILSTLSNTGACVSITTIERLKKILSQDAIKHAVDLMRGPGIINIFLRKFQRLFNKNSMIHATNAPVVVITADPVAADLDAKKERVGSVQRRPL
ncbi:hypothetical protein C8J57DRAFT_1246251 [Mycena rebaudengoi]|nr:hypothetical protein C8J57DRAFT_1246251 [Mycena rebaudengoi]